MKYFMKSRFSHLKSVLFYLLLFMSLPLCAEEPFSYETLSLDDRSSVILSTVSTNLPQGEIIPSTSPLWVIHPAEGAHIPYLKESFVFGSADPEGELFINGKKVPIHSDGGFLAMVSYSTGSFTIRADLQMPATSYSLTRSVFVNPPPGPSQSFPLVVDSVSPQKNMELQVGEEVLIVAKGSSGGQVYFQIQGVKGRFSMPESNGPIAGVYQGVYRVSRSDKLKKSRVKVTLKHPHYGGKAVKYGEGELSLFSTSHRVALVTSPYAVLTAGEGKSSNDRAGYFMYPSKGVKLKVVGSRGDEYRVSLTAAKEAWIKKKDVKLLVEGTPPPHSMAGSLYTAFDETPEVKLALSQKVPFEIRTGPEGKWLDILFYGVTSNTDWINYSSSTVIIKQLQWFQEDPDTYRVRVHTIRNSWWGYYGYYEKSGFVLKLKTPPPIALQGPSLQGITVAIDAGHSPDRGAVGCTGLLEKDANWNISLCLKKKLLKEKVNVIMIREGDEEVGLYDRPIRARKAGADILISVHNNALPEGKNPFERRGYGVYYFHPHSFSLARDIHHSYRKIVGEESGLPYSLKDDGLHYGNLALARSPAMPSVLTESSYMIVPEEEALLKTEKYQCLYAEAMLKGIKRYVKRMRIRARKIAGKKK